MRYGMVIDLRRCVGCSACSAACRAENGTPAGISFNKLNISEIGKYPNSKMQFLPMPCMHCKNPPCLDACQPEATYVTDDGRVLVDSDKCIGCGACTLACPYGSRELLTELKPFYEGNNPTPYETKKGSKHRIGTSLKCTFCSHRIEQGRKPACVETCPALARTFGDLDDPESDMAKLLAENYAVCLKPDEGTEPSVFYIRA